MQQGTGAAAVDPHDEERPVLTVAMINEAIAIARVRGKTVGTIYIDDLPAQKSWDSPAYHALLAMAREGHGRAKSTLQMKHRALKKYCHRAMKGTKRTPYLDEIRQKVFVMKLKGEL